MVYEEVKIKKSLGSVLINDIKTDLGVLYKGHIITEEDIVMLQVMGVETIVVATVEDGDMEMKTAQDIIANKICGKDTAYVVNEDGIVKIIASKDGYLVSDENRVIKFNKQNQDIILNTIPLYSYVKTGEVVAKLEFNVPIYNADKVEDIIFSLSGNVDLLSIVQVEKKKIGVIYSEFYKDKQEKKFFTQTISKITNVLENMKVDFAKEYFAKHNVHSLSDEIENSLDAENDITFIISSIKTQGSGDVVPTALKSIVDVFVKENLSSVGVSDFIVATKRNKTIINIPHNYKDESIDIIDEMILKAFINEKLTINDFDLTKNVLNSKDKLSAEEQKRVVMALKKDNKKINVAVAILAAGASMRTGNNKLLVEVNGEPLFLRAVKEAIKSGVGPVFVVTGHQKDKIEKALAGLDVNVINNLSYREGVKSSIKLAVGHVPGFCEGLLLLPADMPNITAEHLVNMVKKIDKKEKKQVIVSSNSGVKLNPILWMRDLIQNAEIVPENSYLRPALIEYEDFTTLVEPKDKEILLDVDYPADFERIKK